MLKLGRYPPQKIQSSHLKVRDRAEGRGGGGMGGLALLPHSLCRIKEKSVFQKFLVLFKVEKNEDITVAEKMQ